MARIVEEGGAMSHPDYTHRTLYVGMHDGVCVLTSADAGQTWRQGAITPLAHAAARLTMSPTVPQRAYLAAMPNALGLRPSACR